ncbi:MAG TPA: response regulator [Anaerolineae bacterium]|nr:response regulator [Anaerolineae bacterium]
MTATTNDGDKRILVVDDDDQVLFVWSNALASARDITLVTALDGQEALEILDRDGFDVVITDLRMPRMDGYQLTEAIRRHDPDVIIIWLTGYRDPSRAPMEARLQVYRCVDKPLTVAQIRSLVREAVQVREGASDHQP